MYLPLARILHFALQVLTWLIIVDVVLSYFPQVSPRNPLVVLIQRVTRPIVAPFKKIIPPQRMGDAYVDFSPILALLAILVLDHFLFR